jgi:hypothetical protein
MRRRPFRQAVRWLHRRPPGDGDIGRATIDNVEMLQAETIEFLKSRTLEHWDLHVITFR